MEDIIIKLPSETIKGILFEHYSVINNKEAYQNINNQSIRYKIKINNLISEEGYIMREKQLVLLERYQSRKEDSDSEEEINE